jgi:hypothetical protein
MPVIPVNKVVDPKEERHKGSLTQKTLTQIFGPLMYYSKHHHPKIIV